MTDNTSFLLPRLPLFRFLNFALVNPALSIGGVILCIVGVAFLVWARQSPGKNWSQTVAAKVDHELLTSGSSVPLRPTPMYAGGTPAAAGSAIVCGGARYSTCHPLQPVSLARGRGRQTDGPAIAERIRRVQETDEGPYPLYGNGPKLNARLGPPLPLCFSNALARAGRDKGPQTRATGLSR
jgi:hypothetical protein